MYKNSPKFGFITYLRAPILILKKIVRLKNVSFGLFLTLFMHPNLLHLPLLYINTPRRMKKTFLLLLTVIGMISANAQISLFQKKNKSKATANAAAKDSIVTPETVGPAKSSKAVIINTPKSALPKKDWSKVDLSKRAADHFMMQLGFDGLAGKPDSISTKGLGRHFNFYFMYDKPFKTDPHFSWAIGAGLGTSNIYFDNQLPNIGAVASRLGFPQYYAKKIKLTTIFFEVPLEIRYYSNPENPNKSWKFAAGAKLGLLLKSYTKVKSPEDANGNPLYDNSYILKQSDKKFFNSTKLGVTGRIGYGLFSVHGDFQITQLIKSGYGPGINPFAIGLTISGL